MATCKCTGEVFVLDDGSETDLDLGNYERFLDIRLTHNSNLTTGTSTKTSIHTQTHMCDDCVCSLYIHLKMYASLDGGNNK